MSRIEDREKTWLKQIGIEVDRSALHDAAGINDDYPVGRGVFIEDQREFIVLVNFEDHIQVVMLPQVGVSNNIKSALTRLVKLNHTFEKMGFATDAYLGFLTVSPANLGTGMQFQGKIVLENKGQEETDTIQAVVEERLRISKGMDTLVETEPGENGNKLSINFITG